MRLCFVGDSIVQGTGDPDCLGWVGRLCAAARRHGLDLTGYNLGVRRDTSADVRARWRAEVARRLPADLPAGILFSFGVNDTTWEAGRQRIPLEATLAHARAILEEARGLAPLLWIGPPPLLDEAQNRRLAALDAELLRLCDVAGVPHVTVFAALRGSRAWRDDLAAGDGVHPGRAGYEALAQLIGSSKEWTAWLDRS